MPYRFEAGQADGVAVVASPNAADTVRSCCSAFDTVCWAPMGVRRSRV